jgi:predicted nucleotidyltransferase
MLDRSSLTPAERATLEQFVDRLREALGEELIAIWLYGSRARGESPKPESDVDLLAITRAGRKDWRAAYRLLTEAADREGASPAFFSLKVVDPDWVAERRRVDSFFIQEVDRDKVVLAGGP